jgi:hypothetical protein
MGVLSGADATKTYAHYGGVLRATELYCESNCHARQLIQWRKSALDSNEERRISAALVGHAALARQMRQERYQSAEVAAMAAKVAAKQHDSVSSVDKLETPNAAGLPRSISLSGPTSAWRSWHQAASRVACKVDEDGAGWGSPCSILTGLLGTCA